MNKKIKRKLNKAFTLVELIVVIAILAIIMLIGTVAYGGIQERMKIRSDKATCAQIGKALMVRETDLDRSKGIQLYPEVVEYDSLEKVEDYIAVGLTPQSMPDGGYIVTAILTESGKKIIVGIGKNDQEISTALYNNKENAGWAWCEDKEISKFITENNLSFTPTKTLAGITGGVEGGSGEGGGGSSAVAIMENSAVTVGSYIAYSGGDYSGQWVVLRNNGGTIEIISKDSVGILTLSGADGYANCVQILNDKCAEYINSTYATSGRSVGATNSSIGRINTTDNPITYEAARTATLPYKDEYYTTDQSIIANPSNSTLKHGTTNTYNNDGYVWLASRYLSAGFANSSFYVRYLDTGGSMSNGSLFKAFSGNESGSNSHSRGVRPVITLKSNIKIIDGEGTSGSPYVLGI